MVVVLRHANFSEVVVTKDNVIVALAREDKGRMWINARRAELKKWLTEPKAKAEQRGRELEEKMKEKQQQAELEHEETQKARHKAEAAKDEEQAQLTTNPEISSDESDKEG